jgi:hypothetical protein
MRIAFNYYRVLQTINLPFSFVLGYMYGLAAFVICFCTAGLFASALFFEWYYQQRYYFYFNRGFSRSKLIGFAFGLNMILATILLIAIHFIHS